MTALWTLLLLIAISAFFALSEMALASSRRSRLQSQADEGHRGARQALALIDQPSKLLAATQTGITAVALLMGVFGESALTASLQTFINQHLPGLALHSQAIGLVLTIVLVTCVSIVLGEIIPKRLAIAHPEPVAVVCAPLMTLFMRVLAPFIVLLSRSADLLLSILPFKSAPAVTSVEDILAFINEGTRTGALAPEESELVGNVLKLEDRSLASMMTPISDVAFLDLQARAEEHTRVLREAPHSRLPVCQGNLQHVMGVAEAHDILHMALEGHFDLASIPLSPPLFVPHSLSMVDLLRAFRKHRSTFAFVVGEFGMTEGIITLDDLLQGVVGDLLPLTDDPADALAVKRADGSWLLDGLLPVLEMLDKLNLRDLPVQNQASYHTVGGFVVAQLGPKLGRLPRKSESFQWEGWRFEVVDVDKNRVDQILATPVGQPDT